MIDWHVLKAILNRATHACKVEITLGDKSFTT